jgi:hypothetical protein
MTWTISASSPRLIDSKESVCISCQCNRAPSIPRFESLLCWDWSAHGQLLLRDYLTQQYSGRHRLSQPHPERLRTPLRS